MEELAYAKVNLSLRVLSRRKDGFHEIETLMTPITLADHLLIEKAHAFAFDCDDPSLPRDQSNLAVSAARLFFAETKLPPHVRIKLQKRIPHGAGLGGGSSDAAAVLRALHQLFPSDLGQEQLLSMAATLGSDVPFFLSKRSALCRGRGEIIESAPGLPQFHLLLLKPSFAISTPSAYARWRHARELLAAFHEPQEFAGITFSNDLERPVFEKFPFLALTKSWLLRQDEVAVALMSGSGSTTFAVLREPTSAEELSARARRELDPDLWIFAGETLAESRFAL